MSSSRATRRPGLIAALSVAVLLVAAGFWYVGAARVPAATPPWERVAPLPTPRSEMVAAVTGGLIYVPGGLGAVAATLDAFEAYDPAVDEWAELPPLPEAVHHPGVTAAAGHVFVMGGFSGLDFSAGTDRVFAYDPEAAAWEERPPMPGRRGAHALVTVDELVYVIGGVGDAPQELWRFDPSSDAWERDLAPLPTAREHLAAVAAEGRIYAIAGRWGDLGNLGTLEVYDPNADEWSPGPELPTARSGLTAVVADGRIHVAGGEDLQQNLTFDTHEIFDVDEGAWEVGVDLLAPRHGLASAVVEGRWYLIGGATRPGAQTIVSLTPVVDVLDLERRSD